MLVADTKQIWESILVEVELDVSPATFKTWFTGTAIARREDGTIYVSVPNDFSRTWLSEKYHRTIMKLLRDRMEGVRSVEYVIDDSKVPREEQAPRRRVGQHTPAVELPLADHYTNKADNLNPRYRFDTFVIGAFNELAHAASQAVVKNPGGSYNPLFVFGETGHGKTHLIQAVGNAIQHQSPGKRVYYITSEKFSNEYVSALQNSSIVSFKKKYGSYDVLIMDDIQFFSKTEKIQEELFHVFNNLYADNKQVVFSSDKHPNYLPALEARLRSRFAAGMIVEIPSPDHDSRVAIIETKARALNLTLPEQTISFLANAVAGNIRELEGALNTILCQVELKNKQPNLLELKSLIKESVRPKKMVSTEEVVHAVSSFYGIGKDVIYEKTRRKEVVKPRQIIMYIMREDFGISFPTIGQNLGGRDHTTVIHSYEKVKGDMTKNHELAEEIDQIRTALR